MEIAIGLIEQGDNYILQRRSEDQRKGASGLLGFFGGQIDLGESSIESVSREINEETTLDTKPSNFTFLGEVVVVSDRDLQPIDIHAYIFKTVIPISLSVVAKEGQAVFVSKVEAKRYLEYMTPATKLCFEKYIIGEK